MRTSELAAREDAKPARSPRQNRPRDRARELHNFVIGEFSRLGVVDHGDTMTTARNEWRSP